MYMYTPNANLEEHIFSLKSLTLILAYSLFRPAS